MVSAVMAVTKMLSVAGRPLELLHRCYNLRSRAYLKMLGWSWAARATRAEVARRWAYHMIDPTGVLLAAIENRYDAR